MTLAATFLSGAGSRLLPASVPIRFFAAAAFFHVLMWLALFDAAPEITHFSGGIGPPLAAVHVLTVGVFITTAIGASVQLLPVATRRTLAAVWPIKLVFWLVVPRKSTLRITSMWEYAMMANWSASRSRACFMASLAATMPLRSSTCSASIPVTANMAKVTSLWTASLPRCVNGT